MLWFGAILFIQLDDDGQKFIVAMPISLMKWQEKNIIRWRGVLCYYLGGFIILMFLITNVKMNHQPFKFLMESNQFIRKLDKFENMILT
jgi:hypothetical protein